MPNRLNKSIERPQLLGLLTEISSSRSKLGRRAGVYTQRSVFLLDKTAKCIDNDYTICFMYPPVVGYKISKTKIVK